MIKLRSNVLTKYSDVDLNCKAGMPSFMKMTVENVLVEHFYPQKVFMYAVTVPDTAHACTMQHNNIINVRSIQTTRFFRIAIATKGFLQAGFDQSKARCVLFSS